MIGTLAQTERISRFRSRSKQIFFTTGININSKTFVDIADKIQFIAVGPIININGQIIARTVNKRNFIGVYL